MDIPPLAYLPFQVPANVNHVITREHVKELITENNKKLWLFSATFSKKNIRNVPVFPDNINAYRPLFNFLIQQNLFAKIEHQTSQYVSTTQLSLRHIQAIKKHIKDHFTNTNNKPHIHIIISELQFYY